MWIIIGIPKILILNKIHEMSDDGLLVVRKDTPKPDDERLSRKLESIRTEGLSANR